MNPATQARIASENPGDSTHSCDMTTPSALLILICASASNPIAPASLSGVPAESGVRLVGWVAVPADARDKSGLADTLPGGMPHDRLGGFGSAIAATGSPNRYLLLPDRGPADGAEPYRCRWHEAEIRVRPGVGTGVSFSLVSTTLLSLPKVASARDLVGLSSLVDADPARARRFDPEGARVLADGSVLVTDEYGPLVAVFDRASGERTRVLDVPGAFKVKVPLADGKAETAANASGRVANHGFEGVTLTPDRTRAFVFTQGALIQDGGKQGTMLRIVEFDLKSGSAERQYAYAVADPAHTVSEVLALDDHRLLVLERDSRGGREARHKKIILADLRGASDVSAVESLASGSLPDKVRAVARRDFIDLLDPALGLDLDALPAKIEGLAFGPEFSGPRDGLGGERCLLVTSDNDFKANEPSYIWALAIPAGMLADTQAK